MKYLKSYLSYFVSVYAICGSVGMLLKGYFSIYTTMGAVMFAATVLTAFQFVKQEHRAPTKAEQRYFAKHCTIYALLTMVGIGVLFLVLTAFYHGMGRAMMWLKAALWEAWWATAFFFGMQALICWYTALFAFGFLARKRAEELK